MKKIKILALLLLSCLLIFQLAVTASWGAVPSLTPVDSQPSSSTKPHLIISSYKTKPSEISPGQSFKLKLNIKNTSSKSTKNILVSIGGLQSADNPSEDNPSSQSSDSISVTSTGNSRYIKELKGEKEQIIEFNMLASPKAPPGLHKLEISIEYSVNSGESFSAVQQIGVKLSRKINLKFQNVTYPKEIIKGETFPFNAEIVNTNNFKVEGVSVELIAANASIEGDSQIYVGSFDSGDSENLEVKISPNQTSTQATVKIKLITRYVDDFNQEKIIAKKYIVKIKSPPKPNPVKNQANGKKQKNTGIFQSIIDFIKGLLGL